RRWRGAEDTCGADRAIETRRASRRGPTPTRGGSAKRDRERRQRGGTRIRGARRLVSDLDDRERAARAAHDDAHLTVLRRLRRFRWLDRHLGIEGAERVGRAIEQLLGGGVARDDEVRVVRRVVPPVVRVEAVAGHELDLFFAADDALRVRVPRERDGLQLLTKEERGVVLESLALADDDVALGLGLLGGDERVAH